MSAILPVRWILSDHAQVRFMNQGCALNALTGRFTTKMTARQPAQFVVDKRDQLIQGSVIALSPANKQFRYLRMGNRAFISRSHRMTGNGASTLFTEA
jgi:hypothetical protein